MKLERVSLSSCRQTEENKEVEPKAWGDLREHQVGFAQAEGHLCEL